jgi:hypothetical protein
MELADFKPPQRVSRQPLSNATGYYYRINFGDDTTATSGGFLSVSHTYSSAGTYTAALSDPNGNQLGSATITVTGSGSISNTPTATIDSSSLIQTGLASFHVTGSATNTGAVNVFLMRALPGGDLNYNEVVGGKEYSYQSLSNPVENDRWSAAFNISNSDVTGFFKVLVYDTASETYLGQGTLLVGDAP